MHKCKSYIIFDLSEKNRAPNGVMVNFWEQCPIILNYQRLLSRRAMYIVFMQLQLCDKQTRSQNSIVRKVPWSVWLVWNRAGKCAENLWKSEGKSLCNEHENKRLTNAYRLYILPQFNPALWSLFKHFGLFSWNTSNTSICLCVVLSICVSMCQTDAIPEVCFLFA